MKKRIALLVAAILVLCMMFPSAAFAEERAIEVPPADEIIDGDFAEAFVPDRASLTGSGSISKLSSTSAKCYGVSEIYPANTQLEVKIELQQYRNGSWNTYKSANLAVNGTKCELRKTYTVVSGYYYRVKTTHRAAGEINKYAATKGILF